MKKYMLAAVLSVLLLTAACSKEETKTADAKTSSVLSDSETEASDHADGKSEIEKEADEATEKVSENQSTAEMQSFDEQSKEIFEAEEQNNQSSESPADEGSSQSQDIEAIGSELFEKSCQVTWNMLIGCPYNLDYDTMTNSGAVLIDDPAVTSLEDIINDYCQIFASPDGGLYDKYFESENGVYCFDGGRGADRSYTDTKLELVSQNDTEAVFNAVSHFKDPDTEESKDDETNIFVIVKSDGVWKTKTFTLPY